MEFTELAKGMTGRSKTQNEQYDAVGRDYMAMMKQETDYQSVRIRINKEYSVQGSKGPA